MDGVLIFLVIKEKQRMVKGSEVVKRRSKYLSVSIATILKPI